MGFSLDRTENNKTAPRQLQHRLNPQG